MALVKKISSNVTDLRFGEEVEIGVLPTSPVPVLYPLEPNSFDDFGGELTRIARNPINSGRQRKKGAIVDLSSTGGFETDFTQTNLQRILQGFFFADYRTKAEMPVAVISGSPLNYVVAGTGAQFSAGDLVFGKGFSNDVNNGLRLVTASATNSVSVAGLAAASGQSGIISRVGHQFASGDVQIDVAGLFPAMISAAFDMTKLGLSPGELVWVGGDAGATSFAGLTNNGFKRVKSVNATTVIFDKSDEPMTTDAGTGKTIRIFMGRVLKNEVGTDIKRRTYTLERTLGVPDTSFPNAVQSELIKGAVPGELELTLNTADKATANLSFTAIDHEPRTATTGLLPATRPQIEESELYNTSSDIKRIRMAVVSNTNEAPQPLFGFLTELSITLNNNLEENKALGYLGSFEVTEGTFQIDSACTAYFSSNEAVVAVRNNADVTLDILLVANNAGTAIDLPMIGLGDARADVEQDQAIMLPLTSEAGTGAKYDPNMNHTMLMVFFDYLPDVAEV